MVLYMEETIPEWLRKKAHIAKYVEYPNNKSKVIHLFHETLYTGLTRSFISLKRTSILVFKERLVALSLGKSDINKFAGTVLDL